MFGKFGAAALLSLALVLPVEKAAAQDPIGGAILGGAAGALIGGAVGGRHGVGIGAVIGATTGAIIAAEGQRRRGGYYYYQRGCYLQRPDGAWVRAHPRYCAEEVYEVAPAAGGDPIAACARRYRSYDPVSQTYTGYDGIRRPCP